VGEEGREKRKNTRRTTKDREERGRGGGGGGGGVNVKDDLLVVVIFYFYQLDTQILFLIHLLHSSTCFEHNYAHLQEDNCISTASGIVTVFR